MKASTKWERWWFYRSSNALAARRGVKAPSAVRVPTVVLAPRWLLLFLAAGFAAACSSDGPTEPEVRADTLVEIRLVEGNRFSPANVIVNEGTRIRWIADTGGHTITPDGHSEWQRFPTSGLLAQTDTFAHVFDSAGEFPYFCEPHRSVGMVGSIEVR